MKDVLLYVIDGFLDSGKTTFINQTIESNQFDGKGNTLLVTCEEGEIEIDSDFLKRHNVVQMVFEDEKDFDVKKIAEMVKKNDIVRVLMENNAMWNIDYDFPTYFKLAQYVTFINYETFPVYFQNMKQRYVDMIRNSDLVIFNRCENIDDLRSKYQTNLKMVNNRAQYILLDEEGRGMVAFEEELPYDIEAKVIEIKDDDYGIFYIDTFDHHDRYEGKNVSFNCMVVKSDKLPKDSFIAGRMAMTCCANDVQLFGHLCSSSLNHVLLDKAWIHITAKITYEWSEEYQEEEAVLYPIEIKAIKPLDNPILNFTN